MPPSAPRTLEQRRARLVAALSEMQSQPPTSRRWAWLNTWRGVGAILDGMTAQGYDVEIMQQPHGWWARFYLSSASHPTCAGSGWDREPWRAVQKAAWETLTAGDPESRLREQLAKADARRPPNPSGGPAAGLRATR